jgi:hypothetical protein
MASGCIGDRGSDWILWVVLGNEVQYVNSVYCLDPPTHVCRHVKYDITHLPTISVTAGTTMKADSIWKSSGIFVQYTAVTIRFFTHHI